MTLLGSGKVNYGARIERAARLAEVHEFAREVLTFYGAIAKFQREYYESLPKLWGKKPVAPPGGDLRVELDLRVVLGPLQDLLKIVGERAPGALAREAKNLEAQGRAGQGEILREFWKTGLLEERVPGVRLADFFARVVLEAYADFVCGAMLPPAPLVTTCRCPRCNSLPLLGVLRPEGDGGKRFLLCGFCGLEWEFRRILCAQCGEEQEAKLPIYVAEQLPHIRMECCETCKHFLRTIDLTKDGNAVPVVDDLAALPLSLWAEEHGYRRIQENLLGT
jgi:formate dehydrogenase accessory protein FdhE